MISLGDVAALVSGVGTLTLAFIAYRQVRENRGLIEAAKAQARAAQATATENRGLIEAAVAQANAARDQATASIQMVQEVQLDRELAWRPWLAIRSCSIPTFVPRTISQNINDAVQILRTDGDGLLPLAPSVQVWIENIGSGLALQCRYVAYYSIPDEGARATQGLAGSHERFVGGRAYYTTETFNLGARDDRQLQANQATPGAHVTAVLDGTDWQGQRSEVHVLLCVDQFGRGYRFVRGRAHADTWPEAPSRDGVSPQGKPNWVMALTWI